MHELVMQCEYSDCETLLRSHHHLSCEVIYVESGEALFTINKNSYHAQPGSVVLVNSYEQHSCQIVQTPYRRYFALIDLPALDYALHSPLLSSCFRNRPHDFVHCVTLPEQREGLTLLFRQLLKEQRTAERFHSEMTLRLIEQLLITVCRACPANFLVESSSAMKRIVDIQQYIEQHFLEDIKVTALSDQFYISPSCLTHSFKKYVGCSPKQYITMNRISYAKELLENTDIPVNVVAYKAGFGDTNNFIRTFRECFASSPNQYRKSRHNCTTNAKY